MRDIRTEAATFAAAYSAYTKKSADETSSTSEQSSSIAGSFPDPETSVMYEAPNSSAITAITSVGDHILLAVTGNQIQSTESSSDGESQISAPEHTSASSSQKDTSVAEQVEATSGELSNIIRERMRTMTWPDQK